MHRTIQGLVSRQRAPAQTQPLFMIYLANSYVCGNCKRYLLGRRLSGETVIAAGVGAGGSGGGRGGGIHQWQQQQQREIHVSARNLRRIDWEKRFQKFFKGRGIQLRDVVFSLEEWRLVDSRTALFPEIRDESSVASPESLGTKLVDQHPFITSTELWRILLAFRRRLYGDAGVKEIWEGMKLRGIDLPTEGPSANEFWRIFLRSALRDDTFMQEIWVYIQDLDSRGESRRAWDGIYDTIIRHLLLTDPLKAKQWHYLLYPRHTSKSLPELFTTVLQQRPDVHFRLREIHAITNRPAGIYSTMIPLLCTMGLHAEAVRWHIHCLSFADLPEDTSMANDLIKWMTKYGSITELHQLLYSFVETGVKMMESSLVAIITARPDKMEALRFILARSNEFDTTAMGDTFWAHVVNQRNLERADIYRYLQTFGPGLVVGQETVEAIVRRFELPVDKAVWLLAEIGITFREGDFAPKGSTPENPTPVGRFRGLVGAERGPRTIEEIKAQLQGSLAARDWKRFDYILRFHSPEPLDAKMNNIILQSDLIRGRLRESLHRIEHMRMYSIAVSTLSLQLVITKILRNRRRGCEPDTRHWYLEDDIYLVIGLLFSFLRSGATKVEPHLWLEVFKRLGMMRRLLDIEALAIELVEWYHPTRSISTRQRFVRTAISPSASTATPTTVAGVVAEGMPLMPVTVHPTKVSNWSKQNHLRMLFPTIFFQAIVEWGFLTFRPYSPKTTPLIPPPPPKKTRKIPKKYEEFWNCVPRFTWGITFAKRLNDLGVFVDPRVIARAISVRLKPIFNMPKELKTRKAINQLGAALNYLTLEEIVVIAEKAWGRKLYKRKGWKRKVGKNKRKVTCECGKEKFEVEDGERQIYESVKRDKAMRKEVIGDGVPMVKMLSRWRRMKMRKGLRKRTWRYS